MTITIKKRIYLVLIIFALFSLATPVFAAVPTGYGVNIMQRVPGDTGNYMDWCVDDVFGTGVDGNGYEYISLATSTNDLDFRGDHHQNCSVQSDNYRIPTSIPTQDVDGFHFYIIHNQITLSNSGPRSVFIDDSGSGQLQMKSSLSGTTTLDFVYGAESYSITKMPGSLYSWTGSSESVWHSLAIMFNTDLDSRVYALLYTDSDLMGIASATEFAEYMDNLTGTIESQVNESGTSATSTRIVAINFPYNGQITSSTDVTFDFDYYFNDVQTPDLTVAGFDLRDMTGGLQYETPEELINVSGVGNFSESMILPEGHLHLWRPYLRNSDSTDFIYGSWQSFDVVTGSAPQTFVSGGDSLSASSTMATSTIFYEFLPAIDALKERVPFAYYYQIKSVFDSAGQDETGEFPEIQLDLSSTTIPMNLTILSADTIDNSFLPEGFIDTARDLIGGAFWLALGFMILFTSRDELKRSFSN